jgi:hypothetical protein
MIYEERIYKVKPAQRQNFIEFYGANVIPRLAKCGGKIIGVWETVIGDRSNIIVLMAYQDMTERMKCWDAFRKDAEFNKFRPSLPQETDIVSILQPVSYSPMQ